jgi:hypothetical protein
MDIQRVHATLSTAEQRRDALLIEGTGLRDDGKAHEATAVLAKAKKLQEQIGALARALQAWRR